MDLDTFTKISGWIVSAISIGFIVVDRIKKNSLVEYKLNDLIKKVDDIKQVLDNYDTLIEEKINKAIETHVAIYHHKKEGK